MENKFLSLREFNYFVNENLSSHIIDIDIDKYLKILIDFLPNDGKLYKYKSCNENAVSMVEDEYLWLSNVKKFFDNDPNDCMINYLDKEKFDLIKIFKREPIIIFKIFIYNLFKLNFKDENKLWEFVEDVSRYFNMDTFLIDKKVLSDSFSKFDLSLDCDKYLDIINSTFNDDLLNNEYNLSMCASYLLSLLKEPLRDYYYVCSLTDSYKNKYMWDNYCNNEGLCIEYDFNKCFVCDDNFKKIVLNIYKVEYANHNYIGLSNLFYLHSNDCKYEKIINQIQRCILDEQLKKEFKYKDEREYRLFVQYEQIVEGFSCPFPLISKIVLSNSLVQSPNGQKIIDLSQERGYELIIRYSDEEGGDFMYCNYDDYLGFYY